MLCFLQTMEGNTALDPKPYGRQHEQHICGANLCELHND